MKLYYTNQTADRKNAREIELKIEQATGLELDNPFYDGDAKEVKALDATGKSDMSADEICGRDLKRIRDAEGLLAYMTIDRNIGSVMEIAICAFSWGKPVYVIAVPQHIRQHPWIVHFATEIFENHYQFIKWYVEKHNKVAQKERFSFVAKEQIKEKVLVVDTETTGVNPHKCNLLGVSTSDGIEATYECPNDEKGAVFYKNFRFEKLKLVGHNIKYDQIVLRRHGIKTPQAYFDTMIAYYLLNINKSKKLENIVKEVFQYDKLDLVQVYNKSTGQKRVNLPEDWYEHINKDMLAEYAMEDAEYTYKLYELLSEELEQQPILHDWFYNIEMPVLNILTEMELKGVKLNRLKLESLRDELTIKSKDLEKRILYLTGQKDFNLNSPKQLQDLLYKKFKLPVLETTESGQPSTDKSTLVELEKQTGHIFLNMFLKYREYQKVLSTYTDSMLNDLDEKDRIHTTYNQALTNTRRFSSNSPNLQNIPTRSEIGKRVKECFVPEAGHVFLIADYSQLEPRILAHLSQDKFLIDCFKNGKDIYEDTASIVQKAGFNNFSRDKAKTLFLALMYGKSSYGLASDWHCTQNEAQEIIDAVFKKLSGVSAYIEETHERAFKNAGWLTTLAGLPLYVGNPHTNAKWESAQVDRCAVNYPIQGSSQDILKKAMVNIAQRHGNIPVLMVHDELVYELSDFDGSLKPEVIINEMETAWKLSVPLKVEYKISDHWEK